MLNGSRDRFNEKSLYMIRTVYNNFKIHPTFRDYIFLINEHDINGSVSITATKFGQFVNVFYFYSDSTIGQIGSIAIYGSKLDVHYNSINSSKLAFGLKISEIELVTTNTQSPFVDVFLEDY